jgi:asparagine synthase (glutamine-hydrolysing)
MCGIWGVVGIESREVAEGIVGRMMAAMVHRGPDEEGILLASPVAVGMRRLSIVDLPGGSQPVWSENETIAVVYNGEIYNFRELRAQLEAPGHRFRTRSDTVVVVHAYESWGERCVERLNGMVACSRIAAQWRFRADSLERLSRGSHLVVASLESLRSQ